MRRIAPHQRSPCPSACRGWAIHLQPPTAACPATSGKRSEWQGGHGLREALRQHVDNRLTVFLPGCIKPRSGLKVKALRFQ